MYYVLKCILKHTGILDTKIFCAVLIDLEWLIVGSSEPSHLVFGILRFRTNIWHFIKAFR